MREHDDTTGTRLLRGLVAGAVAGVVASFLMDRFQAAAGALMSSGTGSPPATEQAADAIARAATGAGVPDADRPLAGQAIHYALGTALGAAYGIAAEFRPAVTAGYGTALALGTATLLDEGAVPAAGLGEAPWKADPSTTLYAYASHLVFGAAAEFTRRRVAATLVPEEKTS